MPPASARQVSPSSRPTTGRTTGGSGRPSSSSSSSRHRPASADSPFTTTTMMSHIIDPNLQATPNANAKAQGGVAPTPSPMRFDTALYGGMSTPAGSYQSGQGNQAAASSSGQILQPQANGSGYNGDMAPPAVPAKRSYSDTGAMDDSQGMMGGPYVDQYGRAYAPGSAPQLDSLEPAAKRVRRDTGDAMALGANDAVAPAFDGDAGQADVSMLDGASGQADPAIEEETPLRPVPEGMRLSTKPHRPRNLNSSAGVTAANKNRLRLLAIFDKEQDASFDISAVLSTPGKNGDGAVDTSSVADEIDIDQVIDDRGHAALHWATALARGNIVAQLLQKGADMHCGNFAGETPLIRAVLTTNNADANTLGTLIAEHLHPSLHTIDSSHRTVLHHIALIAGVKGRATSATAYMSNCLEYLTRYESDEGMRAFVNVQDIHGDTALCVAARVGNKALVKLLLEAGADKAKANDLGFRPTDYGLDVPVSWGVLGCWDRPSLHRDRHRTLCWPTEMPFDPPSSGLARSRARRAMRCRSVSMTPAWVDEGVSSSPAVPHFCAGFVELIKELDTGFKSEMALKHAQVEQIRGEVIAATHELAAQRKQVSVAQTRLAEYEEVQQKIANLERTIKDEDAFDWQTGLAGSAAQENPASAGTDSMPSGTAELLSMPIGSDPASDLPELHRLHQWYTKTAETAHKRLEAIQGLSAEKAVQYSKVIAACVKVPVEKLDEVGMSGRPIGWTALIVVLPGLQRLLDELIVAVSENEVDGGLTSLTRLSADTGRK